MIRAGPEPLWCGAWSPDGERILTGADNGIVRGWPVDIAHVLELARARTTREPSPEQQARVDLLMR